MTVEFSLVYKRPKVIASIAVRGKQRESLAAKWHELISWCEKNNLKYDSSRMLGLVDGEDAIYEGCGLLGVMLSDVNAEAVIPDGNIEITVVPAGAYWERHFNSSADDLSDLFVIVDKKFNLPAYLCRDVLRPKMQIAEHSDGTSANQRTICIPVTVAA